MNNIDRYKTRSKINSTSPSDSPPSRNETRTVIEIRIDDTGWCKWLLIADDVDARADNVADNHPDNNVSGGLARLYRLCAGGRVINRGTISGYYGWSRVWSRLVCQSLGIESFRIPLADARTTTRIVDSVSNNLGRPPFLFRNDR